MTTDGRVRGANRRAAARRIASGLTCFSAGAAAGAIVVAVFVASPAEKLGGRSSPDDEATLLPSARTHASPTEDRVPIGRGAGPRDGGPELEHPTSEPRSLGDCLASSLGAQRELLEWVGAAHRRARARCVGMMEINPADMTGDPRAPCGMLTEELWGRASDDIRPILVAVRDLSPNGTPDLGGSLWRDLDCQGMGTADFAAALHLASLAPAWTDPDFLVCAVVREADREEFPLWAALDAASVVPHAEAWLPRRSFGDERTVRRIRALLAPGAGRQTPHASAER